MITPCCSPGAQIFWPVGQRGGGLGDGVSATTSSTAGPLAFDCSSFTWIQGGEDQSYHWQKGHEWHPSGFWKPPQSMYLLHVDCVVLTSMQPPIAKNARPTTFMLLIAMSEHWWDGTNILNQNAIALTDFASAEYAHYNDGKSTPCTNNGLQNNNLKTTEIVSIWRDATNQLCAKTLIKHNRVLKIVETKTATVRNTKPPTKFPHTGLSFYCAQDTCVIKKDLHQISW